MFSSFLDGNYNNPPLFTTHSPPSSSSSTSSLYSSSLPSCHLLRSTSSQSFSLHNTTTTLPYFSPSSSSPPSSYDFLDFHAEPAVRRVYSTGDLQGMNVLQVSGETVGQEAGMVAGRVGRYSAEERKERIERYRHKRNQRNFHKKITYACRKTLADSRPRVRGRFARNGEPEVEEGEGEAIIERIYQNYQEEYENCNNNNHEHGQDGGGDWWGQMQKVLGGADEEEECYYDNDTWANYLEDFSVNLLS
ncbi:hypothetical protein J5N97_002289 [Dioscorea zingiberensis]|uniref:CCT domain-containing protein n=1 Tax=Dioscorea zingiberensis TaxID=325984 RepID=A0A9D5D4H1_9LILI|nr:hypothetical protein J5N97_002289 [Dioscorea zingiberensis]